MQTACRMSNMITRNTRNTRLSHEFQQLATQKNSCFPIDLEQVPTTLALSAHLTRRDS